MGCNPFTICMIDGMPRLMKNGTPVFPLLFWQTEVAGPEASAVTQAGVEIFTCFRSGPYYDHPYWTGEGEYDFRWYDEKISDFFRLCPNAYLIPRIFVCAPYWWLEKHPEELVGIEGNPPRSRGFGGKSTFHESFASELWKKEQGEALRQLIRHFRSMPWGDRIVGIHVAGGPCGEWHSWSGYHGPDFGPAMAKRYGKTVSSRDELGEEYYEAYYSAAVDAIAHFCTVVKKESDYLTVVFYGYFLAASGPDSHTRMLDELLHLDCVDMLTTPHVYARRRPGEDAYFRAFPATVAKHGKLFIDEGDDRTPLGQEQYNCGGRIMGATPRDAINMLRREFGNAITHCVGLWYMDIDDKMFRATDYFAEIERAGYWGKRSLKLPCRRVSEIAVLCDEAGRTRLPTERIFDQTDEETLRELQFPEFCKIGAPFDFYTTDDADVETLSKYRMIVLLDGVAISERVRKGLKALQKENRAFVWFYGAGAFRPEYGKYLTKTMSDLTGIRFALTPDQEMPRLAGKFRNWHTARITPGFSPREAMADFGTWSSWYFGTPDATAERLREICRRCGVFVYSETSDVFSASESALMLHASQSGTKVIRLPNPKTVTDMISGRVVGKNIYEFRFVAEQGDTALFELA